MDLTNPNMRLVMQYIDLRLAVDVEPDNNGCMWMELARWVRRPADSSERFDLKEDEVIALRDACNEYLARRVAQKLDDFQA